MTSCTARSLTLALVPWLAACGPTLATVTDEGVGEASSESGAIATGAGQSLSVSDGEVVDGTASDDAAPEDDTDAGTGGAVACGNGRVELDELCDDGNRDDADGCNADCQPSGTVEWIETVDSGLGYDLGIAVLVDAQDNPSMITDLDAGDDVRAVGLQTYTSEGQPQFSFATEPDRKFDAATATTDGGLSWVHHKTTARHEYVLEHFDGQSVAWTVEGIVEDVVHVDAILGLEDGQTIVAGVFSSVLRYVTVDDAGEVHPGGFRTGVDPLRGLAPFGEGFVALSQTPTEAFFFEGDPLAFQAEASELPTARGGPFSMGAGQYGYVGADAPHVVVFDDAGQGRPIELRQGPTWVDGVTTPAGNLVVVGYDGETAVAEKFTVDGKVLWTRTVDEVATLLDVAADSDGAVYAVGVVGNRGTNGDGALVKLSP